MLVRSSGRIFGGPQVSAGHKSLRFTLRWVTVFAAAHGSFAEFFLLVREFEMRLREFDLSASIAPKQRFLTVVLTVKMIWLYKIARYFILLGALETIEWGWCTPPALHFCNSRWNSRDSTDALFRLITIGTPNRPARRP